MCESSQPEVGVLEIFFHFDVKKGEKVLFF